MELQKPGNFPGPEPEVVERQKVAKKRMAQKVCRWTVQNEIRGVLGPMSANAARRILDSANPIEIRTGQKAVFVAAKTKERERERA